MGDILGLVPARGGSKGIPQKNLYPVMGKPLLQYTIEAAKGSRHLTRLMLSSENLEIRTFAACQGVKSEYVRPSALATDEASLIDVALHALHWLENKDQLPDIVVLLQPTSPLRTAQHIDSAIEQFLNSGCSSLVSVHPMKEHPWKSIERRQGENWKFLAKPMDNVTRRQGYPEHYYTVNGALYIITPDFLREKGGFVVEGETDLFIMESAAGVDVDELSDIFLTEAHLKCAALA